MAATASLTFRDIRSRLRTALGDGAVDDAQAAIAAFHELVVAATADNDRRALATLGGQADRLIHLAQSGQAPEVVIELRTIARAADIAWNTLAMRDNATAPATPERFAPVRKRVLDAMADHEPHRPADLARELGVHRTQVSRALTELKKTGLVTRLEATDATDGRAAAWRAAS